MRADDLPCLLLDLPESKLELNLETIGKEMQKIFQEHLTKKKMTREIMQQGISNYVNQFDPRHVYLLRDEVKPFLDISTSELNRVIEQYYKGDYSLFAKLNRVIQKAISRMREYRRQLPVNIDEFNKIAMQDLPKIPDGKEGDSNTFTDDLDDLKKWHATFFARLVSREVGILKALNRPAGFVDAVRVGELDLESDENGYLYRDRLGHPLDAKEEESTFAFHILRALTASLDVHSQFLNTKEAESLRMKLEKEYVGLGFMVQEQGRYFIVSSIVKGSSIEKSGKVKVGDELISIDGAEVSKLEPEEVQAKLQGLQGTSAKLVFNRKGRGLFEATIEREHIVLEEGRVDTSFEKVPGGIIGIIQLHSFYQGDGEISSEKDVQLALENLSKQGTIKGLVLDLRDNRGGFLMQAVKVAGLFIKSGVIVAAKYSDGSLHYFRDLDPSVLYSGPLVVLTSRETASAAEIVAEALKDYGSGIIVGDEQTYGKGSIQMQTVTKGNDQASYFKVTVGRYYSVSGRSTQLEGVKADVVVPSYLAEKKVGEEFLSGSTIKSDTISPSYNDTLNDVPKGDKDWYQRYYVPFLQQKIEKYRKWIPELDSRSEVRLAKDKNYQNLLKGNLTIKERKGLTTHEVTLDPEQAKRMVLSLQLQEAIGITKDLIELSSKEK